MGLRVSLDMVLCKWNLLQVHYNTLLGRNIIFPFRCVPKKENKI